MSITSDQPLEIAPVGLRMYFYLAKRDMLLKVEANFMCDIFSYTEKITPVFGPCFSHFTLNPKPGTC